MKNARRNFKEAGISLIIFGVTMIFLPSLFEEAEKFNQSTDDGFIMGILVFITGVIVLLFKWIIDRGKNKP